MKRKGYDSKILHRRFIGAGDPAKAVPMKKYMKGHFEFLGIKSPMRKTLLREYLTEYTLPEKEYWKEEIARLWNTPFREFQYVALDLLPRMKKYFEKEDHFFIEKLITTVSWWDTVDALSSNVAGPFFLKFPGLTKEVTGRWNRDGDMWLNRASILFQLKYREKTDPELLFGYMEEHLERDEFFMRKAIGWALRQYAKTDPDVVRGFLRTHKLSPLSYREATRHLRMENDS